MFGSWARQDGTDALESRDGHTPTGSFCWFELGTNNQPAAVAYYQKLFGWDVQDSPMGPGEVYSMFKLNGQDAAAAFTLRAEQRANGVPPHWMIYVAVDDADDVAAPRPAWARPSWRRRSTSSTSAAWR